MVRELAAINNTTTGVNALYPPGFLTDSSQTRRATSIADPRNAPLSMVPAVGDEWWSCAALAARVGTADFDGSGGLVVNSISRTGSAAFSGSGVLTAVGVVGGSKKPMLIGSNVGANHADGTPTTGDYDYYDNLLSNVSGIKPGGTNSGMAVRRSYNGGSPWPCTFNQSSAFGDVGRPCASMWSQSQNTGAINTLGTGAGGAEVANWTTFFDSIPNGHRIWVSLDHELDIKSYSSSVYLNAQVNLRHALANSNKANSPYVQLGVILTASGYNSPLTWINTTAGVNDWCGCDAYYYYEPDGVIGSPNASDYPYNGNTKTPPVPISDWGNPNYTLAKSNPTQRYGPHTNFADAHGLDKLTPEFAIHPDRATPNNPNGFRPKLIHDSIAYWDLHGYKACCYFSSTVGAGSHVPWWLDSFTDWSNRPTTNVNHNIIDNGSLAAYRDELASHVAYVNGMLG